MKLAGALIQKLLNQTVFFFHFSVKADDFSENDVKEDVLN